MTLGIPRLRELFMTAAQTIKTPVMTLPIRQGCGHPQAVELANRLRRIRFAEVTALQSLKRLRVSAVLHQEVALKLHHVKANPIVHFPCMQTL